MPPIVDILIFISMIDTLYESLKAKQIFNCQHFSLFHTQHEKLYNLMTNVQKSLKFRFTPSDYSVQSNWLPYLVHILAVRSMRQWLI